VSLTYEQRAERYKWREADISELVGKVLASVDGYADDSEEVVFTTTDGLVLHMYHEQDCCESVALTDIDAIGIKGIIGNVIALAEKVEFSPPSSTYGESETWTFYKLGSQYQTIVMRWLGSSNGYYSEGVTIKAPPATVEP
jgi:hypothetical protein